RLRLLRRESTIRARGQLDAAQRGRQRNGDREPRRGAVRLLRAADARAPARPDRVVRRGLLDGRGRGPVDARPRRAAVSSDTWFQLNGLGRYGAAVLLLSLTLLHGGASAQPAKATGDQHRDYLFAPTGERMPYRIYVPTRWSEGTALPIL